MLKTMVLQAVDKAYIADLHDAHIGYSRQTTKDILNYLHENYGEITPEGWHTNYMDMINAWDQVKTMAKFLQVIQDGLKIAKDGGVPFTDTQVLTIAYYAIEKSQRFTIACRDWRKHTNKTFEEFKLIFKQEEKDVEMVADEERNNQDNPYHCNYAPYEAHNDIVTQKVNAVQAKDTQALLQRLLREQEEIKRQLSNNTTTNTRSRLWLKDMDCDPRGYCWSHGYKVRKGHTSKTCFMHKPGHQEEETRDNIMGGSLSNKEWVPVA